MLGLVQRLVDFADKRLLRFARPPGSDANADRQRCLMIDQDGAGIVEDRLRQIVQLRLRQAIDDNGKLFPTDTRRQDLLAGQFRQLFPRENNTSSPPGGPRYR